MTELEVGALLFLLWNSITDIGRQKISLMSLFIFCLFRFLHLMLHISETETTTIVTILKILSGILPGLFMCMLGKVSKGALGYGDGIVAMAVGLCVGLAATAEMVMWAFFLSFFWSIALLILNKYKFGSRFPFVPFLLAGFIIDVCI